MDMIIYRLESDSGDGPFGVHSLTECREIYTQWRLNYIGNSDGHPGPYSDGLEEMLMKSNFNWKFACPSVHMIKFWFSPLIPHLDTFKFAVKEIRIVDDGFMYGKSLTQVLYNPKSAVYVRTIPQEELM